MSVQKSKPFYKSRTLQGNIALAFTFVASLLDIELLTGEADMYAKGILGVLGFILAVYGRIVAQDSLTVK